VQTIRSIVKVELFIVIGEDALPKFVNGLCPSGACFTSPGCVSAVKGVSSVSDSVSNVPVAVDDRVKVRQGIDRLLFFSAEKH